MEAIQVNIEVVATGQAIALLAVDCSSRGHRPGSRIVPGLTPPLHLVIGTVSLSGSLVLHGNHQLISGRKFQWIGGVTSVLDWLGILALATAVPLATDELVTLAGKQDAKLIAEIVFKIY